PRVHIQSFELTGEGRNLASTQPPELRLNSRLEEPARLLLDFLSANTGRALFVAESTGRRETLLELLRKRGLAPRTVESWQEFLEGDAKLSVCVAPLQEGIHLPQQGITVISEPQV